MNLSVQLQTKMIFHMGVTALDLGKEELAKSNPSSPFLGEGAWWVYNPGLGKAGSNLALLALSEQPQPLPLLRSDPVKEEDGYQLSHTAAVWNVAISLHTLPNLAGRLGNPRMFLVQTGLVFLLLALDEVGWLPALIPTLRGAKLPAGKLWQGAGVQLPRHPSSVAHLVLGALDGWMLCDACPWLMPEGNLPDGNTFPLGKTG